MVTNQNNISSKYINLIAMTLGENDLESLLE